MRVDDCALGGYAEYLSRCELQRACIAIYAIVFYPRSTVSAIERKRFKFQTV